MFSETEPSTRAKTWGLVVATYKRPEILLRCLRNVLRQTRAPSEIVVVDASPDWAEGAESARSLLGTRPEIEVRYVQARRASSALQRNQGIELATADVLFLIDDDSMMYPECAAEVMRIYEADGLARVSGVMCLPEAMPPDAEQAASAMGSSGSRVQAPAQTWLRRAVKALLNTEGTYFLPYDESFPEHDVSEELTKLAVGKIQVMAGYAMTFRREVLLKERFCEMLERYAAGEDQDLSYRASRHGALLLATKARLCHLEISGGRLSRRTTTALADLNPAAMQVLYSTDLSRSRKAWQRIVRKRLLIRALKDLADKEWTFQRTRGTLLALQRLALVYERTPETIAAWYGGVQKELIDADVASA